jgi:hypothetical protein
MMMASYEVKNKWTLPLECDNKREKTTGILGATFLAAPLGAAGSAIQRWSAITWSRV